MLMQPWVCFRRSLIASSVRADENGPVPNGAPITSATLALQFGGPDAVFKASRLLKNRNRIAGDLEHRGHWRSIDRAGLTGVMTTLP